MSFNPCPSGQPTWLPGEQPLTSAKSVDLKLQLGRGGPTQGPQAFKARGTLHLTNIRLLFLADKPTMGGQGGVALASFDIPLRGILDVRFNQPIFGANNLTGKVQPVNCLGVMEPVEWKASFNEGGTGMFVPTLLRLMDQLAQEATRPQPHPTPAPQPPQQQQQQQQQQPGGAAGGYGYGGYGGPAAVPVAQALSEPGAYVDPADPSRVLVSSGGGQQPPMATANYVPNPLAQASAPPSDFR